MPDYSLGKIYKITGNGKVYIGSTTNKFLSQRFAKHKNNYRCWKNASARYYTTSFECLEDPECKIELLELCPCTCVDELHKCEGKWIRELDCVNRIVLGRTPKEYYDENKDKVLERVKAYRYDNKEAISKKKNAYYEANKASISEKAKERYLEKKGTSENEL